MIKGRAVYPNGWLRHDGIIAYPHGWQTPAKTEQWAYELLLGDVELDPFVQMVCFPWASLVDFLRQGRTDKAERYLNALEIAPPKMGLRRATVCQHIYALELLPFFKKLGITDIYWSHKVLGQNTVEGIALHPFPLYPVMHYRRNGGRVLKPLSRRKYLYSFVGSYQPGLYLSSVREWMFELPQHERAIILKRDEWHFEGDVYRQQVADMTPDEAELRSKKLWEQQYISILEDTVFCPCPSGSGPNSIRLWEAIAFGCIPMLFSEGLDLPGWARQGLLCPDYKETVAEVARIPGECEKFLHDHERISAMENGVRAVMGKLIDPNYLFEGVVR